MVKYTQEEIDQVFYSLSDHTRREMLRIIIESNPTVTELSKPFSMSLPAISKHLRVLEDAGLIKRQKDGRNVRFRVLPKPFNEALSRMSFFTEYWNSTLNKLEVFVNKQK